MLGLKNMRKLIFCFDGTCNDPEEVENYSEDGSVSNILKLHAYFGGSLEPLNQPNLNVPDQQSFYYQGVGTRKGWLNKLVNSMFAPQSGDIEDILNLAKQDLADNFQKSDQIFVFGFSRGAAIARMFAAQILQDVQFLGVFDTVASIFGKFDLNLKTYPTPKDLFENNKIRKGVKKAVHLLALDEKRLAFQPTLFDRDKRILEVWFAGVHSDVGGGYWFDGLSDMALEFMLKQVQEELIILKLTELNFRKLVVGGTENICEDDLIIKPLVDGVIHEQKRSSVMARTLGPRNLRVNPLNEGSEGESLLDLPIIHNSVSVRFNKVVGYRPYVIRNKKYRILSEDGKVKAKPRVGLKEL